MSDWYNREHTPLFDQFPIKEEKETITRQIGIALVYNPKTDSYLGHKRHADDAQTLIWGGIEPWEDPIEATKREVWEETGYTNLRYITELPRYRSHYRHATKQANYYTYCCAFVFELTDDKQNVIEQSELAKHQPQRITSSQMNSFLKDSDDHLFVWNQRQKIQQTRLAFEPSRCTKLQKYEHTDDGCIYSARAHIHNQQWQTLALYDQRRKAYSLPWGKVDAWENIETALAREVEEEIGVTAITCKRFWTAKNIRSWWLVCHVHFDVTIEGTPRICEADKFEKIVRVDIISPNDIRIDGTKIQDMFWHESTWRRHCYDFCETADRSICSMMTEHTPIVFPQETIDKTAIYITFFDQTSQQILIYNESDMEKYTNPYILLAQKWDELQIWLQKVFA